MEKMNYKVILTNAESSSINMEEVTLVEIGASYALNSVPDLVNLLLHKASMMIPIKGKKMFFIQLEGTMAPAIDIPLNERQFHAEFYKHYTCTFYCKLVQ